MIFGSKNKLDSLCSFGLEDDGICFVRMKEGKNGKLTLENYDFLSGESSVHPILLKQISKQYKVKNSTCATHLKHEDYQLLISEKPEVPDDDLIDALQWTVKDVIALPIENVTLDTFYIPNQTSAKKSINVVAASKDKIAQLDKPFEEAKLNLKIIDIEELALRNLAILNPHEKNGLVVLWLSEKRGKILFIKDHDIHLTRNIETGYETILNSYDGVENIALEIQRSLDYFERHYSDIAVQNLLVMPFNAEIPHLITFLDKNLSISCHEFFLNEVVEGADTVKKEIVAKNLITFGTATRRKEKKK